MARNCHGLFAAEWDRTYEASTTCVRRCFLPCRTRLQSGPALLFQTSASFLFCNYHDCSPCFVQPLCLLHLLMQLAFYGIQPPWFVVRTSSTSTCAREKGLTSRASQQLPGSSDETQIADPTRIPLQFLLTEEKRDKDKGSCWLLVPDISTSSGLALFFAHVVLHVNCIPRPPVRPSRKHVKASSWCSPLTVARFLRSVPFLSRAFATTPESQRLFAIDKAPTASALRPMLQ